MGCYTFDSGGGFTILVPVYKVGSHESHSTARMALDCGWAGNCQGQPAAMQLPAIAGNCHHPFLVGHHGGGWQWLSTQLANVFDKAIEKHGGQDALAQTIASEIDERPIEALRLLATLMPKNINLNAEISPSDSLTAALSNVQQALEVQRSEKAQVIEAEYSDEQSENDKAD